MTGPDGTRLNTIALDYARQDTIGVYAEDHGKKFQSGIIVKDKDLRATDPENVQAVPRISIADEDGTAAIVLKDSRGHDRIRLAVDSNNAASILLKDTSGTIIRQFP